MQRQTFSRHMEITGGPINTTKINAMNEEEQRSAKESLDRNFIGIELDNNYFKKLFALIKSNWKTTILATWMIFITAALFTINRQLESDTRWIKANVSTIEYQITANNYDTLRYKIEGLK